MKKLFTLFISLISVGMYAQSLIAYRFSNGVNTATITNGYNMPLITTAGNITETKFKFKNTSTTTHTYNMSRSFTLQNPTLFTDGSGVNTPNSYFCFGQTCFGNDVSIADPSNFTVLNGGDDSQASGQPASIYLAEGSATGSYIVRYKIFNVNDPNDTLSFNAVYNVNIVGIKTLENTMSSVSDLYPNPNGGSSVSFDLAKDEELKFQVYNSLGSMVYNAGKQKYSAGKNKLALDVANLSNGVYFVTITSNSAKTTKRLIVNK